MKKKIVTSALLLAIISSFSIFSSCSKNSLDVPTVQYNKGVISWNKIDKANKYELSINDNIATTYDNEYTLPVLTVPVKYTIKVKAISETPNYIVSEFSKPITFETYMLPTVETGKFSYNQDISEVTIPVSYKGNRCDLYINEQYIKSYTETSLTLNNDQFNSGENTIELKTSTNSKNICDSASKRITVYKNYDFDNIKLKNGDIIGTKDGKEYVCDTTSLPNGESTQIIKNCLPSDSDITLASKGKEFPVNKLPSAVIESFSADKSYNTTITIALHYDGIDYDEIQLSRKIIDESNPVSAESVILQDNQIICTFTFGYSPITYDSYYYTLIVKKNGYVKSSTSYKP